MTRVSVVRASDLTGRRDDVRIVIIATGRGKPNKVALVAAGRTSLYGLGSGALVVLEVDGDGILDALIVAVEMVELIADLIE
jgi:hypothetical protein